MGSMYGAYVVNYKQGLILENLPSFIYFYLIFLPEYFVTIPTGIAQNPGLKGQMHHQNDLGSIAIKLARKGKPGFPVTAIS